jgi:hypothetical protein
MEIIDPTSDTQRQANELTFMQSQHNRSPIEASRGNDQRMEPLVLQSCHSTWIFDTEKMRFRRLLKGIDVENHQATTGWRPYFGLDIDPVSESFVVLLNPDGTRLLRSWRHVESCPQCGGEATGELSLSDLRSAAQA